MQMPCPNPVNCPGVDRPVINLTAEAPDEIKTLGYGFFSDGSNRFCEELSQEAANICAAVPDPDDLSGFGNPPPPQIFTSNPQTCSVLCPDASEERYSVVAGSAVGLSQAAADAAALALACELANLQCAGPVTVYTSTPQTCSITCSNGQVVSFTAPAGLFSGASQSDANTFAYLFACDVVSRMCIDLPPLPGGGPNGGSGNPPVAPVQPQWGNSPQTCTVTCPTGGTTTFTVSAGTFIASSIAIANSIAYSYACQQAAANAVCLGEIESAACVSEFFSAILTVTGLQEPIAWSLIAGALPPGIVLADDLITGTPTVAGSYSFTIAVTGTSTATGNVVSASKSYSMKVMEISTASALPDGDIDTAYSQALVGAGYLGAPTWSITSGTLPDGMTLHPSTGLLSGTPTNSGDFAFVVGLEDEDGQLCTKAFTLTIEALAFSPSNWWKLEEASGNRTDSIRGAILGEFGVTPVTSVPGVIGNGSLHGPATIFSGASLSSAGQDPLLAYEGNGCELVAWFKMDIQNSTDSCRGQYFSFGATTFFLTWETVLDLGFVKLELGADGITNEEIDFPITINDGEWYFVRVYYDAATGLGGIQVASEFDAALPPAVEGVVVHNFQVVADARVSFGAVFSAVPNFYTAFDEVGVFQLKMTDGQAAQVFNGGAGRTFP